jgi:hypothetical protein
VESALSELREMEKTAGHTKDDLVTLKRKLARAMNS